MHKEKRITIAAIVLALISILCADAQTARPEILRIVPTSGPEGSRVEITGNNLQETSAVFFGSIDSSFTLVSPQELIALVPHKSVTANVTVVNPRGRAASAFAFVVANDPRIPDEVSYKAGYVNPVPAPRGFNSAMLWGIAIADTRVPGYESAKVEIASTQLTCRVDGKDVILNDDAGNVRGGLYRRYPWFGTDEHDPMPVTRHAQNTLRAPRRPTSRSRLAFLERLAAGRPSARQPRRLHRHSPRQRFPGRPAASRDGLLAHSDHRLRPRRKQSRSRSQQLVLSLRPMAGSHLHRRTTAK